jgi:short-subunit dehydrogenase
MHIAGEVVVVTGATGGIGRELARQLAGRHARLALAGRDASALEALARPLGAVAVAGDLRTDPEALIDEVERSLGPVAILVNNAGRGLAGPFAETDPGELASLVELDLVAPMRLTRRVLPGMLERRRGHVCFVGSIAGLLGVADEAAYAAAKGGLALFADSLCDELTGSGVGVSHLAPGAVDTAFFERRGRPYGRRLPRPLRAQRVAAAACAAIERDRRRVVLPRWLEVAARLHGAAPGTYRALSGRFGSG